MHMPSTHPQHECARLLKAGELDLALRTAVEWARISPADAGIRIGLFQLMAASGQWQRAGEQLRLASELDVQLRSMTQAYSRVLDAELEREQVVSGRMIPLMLGRVAQWQHDLLQALQQDRDGVAQQAAQRRQLAFEQAEAVGGWIDGVHFDWLCDADPRFGPCLEVVLEHGYAWVALSQLRELTFEPPTSLADLLWQPVNLFWRDGGHDRAVVPCRYPGTERSEHGALRLGRRTDWSGNEEAARGLGQRVLVSSQGEHPLLEVRRIAFDATTAEVQAWRS